MGLQMIKRGFNMTMGDVVQSVSMLTQTSPAAMLIEKPSAAKPATAKTSKRVSLLMLLGCVVCFALGHISAAAIYSMYPPEMMLGSITTGIVIVGAVIAGTVIALVVINTRKC